MFLLIHVHPSIFLSDGPLHTPDDIYGHFRITKANMHVVRVWEEVPGENPPRHGRVCKLYTKEHQLAGAFKPRTMLLCGDDANHCSPNITDVNMLTLNLHMNEKKMDSIQYVIVSRSN